MVKEVIYLMGKEYQKPERSKTISWISLFMDIPVNEIISIAWEVGQRIIQTYTNKGIYEVLDYESTLEIQNHSGIRAAFRKCKRVLYLQDDIIVYQDHAWGDGKILLNYRSNHGKPVDQYKCGYRTYVLLSLREVKNRGNIDDFFIQWNIRRGFLRKDGFWATDVTQRTRHVKVNVIFPKSRPPQELCLEECNRRRTSNLNHEAQQRLPDGRWLVIWEMDNPRLHEIYILRWVW